MDLQRQKIGGAAAARNKTDGPKPAKGPKSALRGKSFAEGEAALSPGGAVDAGRAPKSGGEHCDPLQDAYIEYEFIHEAATNMGIKPPTIAEWSAMKEPDKNRWRELLDGPLNGGEGQRDPAEVMKMYDQQ